jgi:hypothetical protein
MSRKVELPGSYPTIEVTERAAPRPCFLIFEVAGPEVSGFVTFNLEPYFSGPEEDVFVTSGRVSRWTFNGPQFDDPLKVDGAQVEFSGLMPRGNPFPLRTKLFGEGLTFEESGVMPPASRAYAAAIIDAVIGLWYELDKASTSLS